jgi:hypothetical protein
MKYLRYILDIEAGDDLSAEDIKAIEQVVAPLMTRMLSTEQKLKVTYAGLVDDNAYNEKDKKPRN